MTTCRAQKPEGVSLEAVGVGGARSCSYTRLTCLNATSSEDQLDEVLIEELEMLEDELLARPLVPANLKPGRWLGKWSWCWY